MPRSKKKSTIDELNNQLLNVAEKGDLAHVEPLLNEGADLSATDEDGRTALHLASREGHFSIVKLLLDKGANPGIADGYNRVPLHHACVGGHEAIAMLLLDKGTDPHLTDEDNRTPLHGVCSSGLDAVAKRLLDKGADVNAAAEFGWTGLRLASMWGHTVVAMLLLAKGADTEAASEENNGDTSLHLACRMGHNVVARCLLLAGANLEAVNKNNRTPYRLANAREDKALATELSVINSLPIDSRKAYLDRINALQEASFLSVQAGYLPTDIRGLRLKERLLSVSWPEQDIPQAWHSYEENLQQIAAAEIDAIARNAPSATPGYRQKRQRSLSSAARHSAGFFERTDGPSSDRADKVPRHTLS